MYFLRSNRFKAPWLDAHDSFIRPVSFFIVQVVIIIYIVFMIWYMLKIIKDSMFQKKGKRIWKYMTKVGFVAAFGMEIILLVTHFTRDMGPEILFSWQISFIMGAVLWLIARVLQKRISS